MDIRKITAKLKEWTIGDVKAISCAGAIDKLTAKDAMISPVFLQKSDDIDTILRKLKHEDVQACIVIDDKGIFV